MERYPAVVPAYTMTELLLADLLLTVLAAGSPLWLATSLTLPQLRLLLLLRHLGASPVNALAGELQVTGSNAAQLVHRLEAHGYVQRQRDHTDRRISQIALTPAGHQLLQESCSRGMVIVTLALEQVAAEDAAKLHDGLTALLGALPNRSV